MYLFGGENYDVNEKLPLKIALIIIKEFNIINY